MNMMYKK